MIHKRLFLSLVLPILLSSVSSGQQPELVLQTGHAADVESVSFSPDGRILASSGLDNMIKLWDVPRGTELRSLKGHSGMVSSVVFSPDGKILASGSWDRTIKLWDVVKGTELHSLEGHSNVINSVAFTPDGRMLASGSYDGTIKLWNVASGREVRSLGAGGVKSIAFSPDGKMLASGGLDVRINLWNLSNGRKLRTLQRHASSAASVAFSPNGKVLASCGWDDVIEIWDVSNGTELTSLKGNSGWINSVVFSPDGKTLASGGWDKSVDLWDVAGATRMGSLKGHSGAINSVIFSLDGKMLASGSEDNTIKVWDVGKRTELHSLRAHSLSINTVAFNPDRTVLASGGSDGTIKIWDVSGGTGLRSLKRHSGEVRSVAFSPDGKLLASGGSDGTIKIWDVARETEWHSLNAHSGEINSVVFSADGKMVAGGTELDVISLWDVSSGTELHSLKADSLEVKSLAFNPKSNKILVSGSLNGSIKIWDVVSGTQVGSLKGHSEWVRSIVFSPDGRVLASASWDGTIKLWDVANGTELHPPKRHIGGIRSVALSPDGKLLASAGSGGIIKLWDVTSGAKLRSLKGHSAGVYSVAFDPDGKTLISGSLDTHLKLWRVVDGIELASLLALDEEDWVVIDPAGRFDASQEAMNLLHFVVGLERIELDQLKRKYHEPGLLQKILGHDKTPFLLDVKAFNDVKLYPRIELIEPSEGSSTLTIKLADQGGGIGAVKLFINGAERVSDARERTTSDRSVATLTIDLKQFERFMVAGEDNDISVVAYSKDNLPSRAKTLNFKPFASKAIESPNLWAVVAGTSKYRHGGSADLKDLLFAAKDAEVISKAFSVAGESLFPGRVHITTLSTESNKPEEQPSKKNIVNALKAIAANPRATASDILILYLSGHGVSYGGAEGDYYYLTSDAFSAHLEDTDIRGQTAISGKDIEDLILGVPARKRVLIMDTCAAGRFVEELEKPKAAGDGTNVRAWERMKDRIGLWVLAGSAADAVSYEASVYGQGLLTYSLLLGMKRDWQEVLERDQRSNTPELVDVQRLFDYASNMVKEQLAPDIGGIQRPRVLNKRDARSFAIGRIRSQDRDSIRLSLKKPVYLRSSFQLETRPRDPLELTTRMDQVLRSISLRGIDASLVFWDVPIHPETYRISGRYMVEGQKVKLTIFISKMVREGERVVENDFGEPFSIEGDKSKPDELVSTILQEVEKRIPVSPP